MRRAVTIADKSEEAGIRYVHRREVRVGKVCAAGDEKENAVPAETDIAANVAVPSRLDVSLVFEVCLRGYELLLGKEKQLVLLKLFTLAICSAAISLEAAFDTENEVAELHFESGLTATDGLVIVLAVAGNVKRGERGFLSLNAIAAFFVAVNHFVKLLLQIDIGMLFAEIEVVKGATNVEADVKPAPTAGIVRRLFERFPNVWRRGGVRGRLSEENRSA